MKTVITSHLIFNQWKNAPTPVLIAKDIVELEIRENLSQKGMQFLKVKFFFSEIRNRKISSEEVKALQPQTEQLIANHQPRLYK